MTYHQKITGNWIQNGRMGKEIDGRTGKNEGVPSKNRPKSAQNEERREKSGLHRAKNESSPLKNRPKSGSKRGKAGKTEILERKRWGGGAAKKWALLPILQCYEVTK